MLIFLQSKIQPIRAVLSVVCLIVSSYATNAYAEISDMRADLKSVNEQIFRALTVRGELTGDVPDAEVIKELRVFIATLPEDQVAKALVDAEHGLASLEKEIAILKASPSLSDDANGREVEALRSEFYDVYSKCSNTFNKYKKISLIFKSSPCSEYEERVEARIWNVDTPQKKSKLTKRVSLPLQK